MKDSSSFNQGSQILDTQGNAFTVVRKFGLAPHTMCSPRDVSTHLMTFLSKTAQNLSILIFAVHDLTNSTFFP